METKIGLPDQFTRCLEFLLVLQPLFNLPWHGFDVHLQIHVERRLMLCIGFWVFCRGYFRVSHLSKHTNFKYQQVLAISLGIACFYFKKRLISTDAAFVLFLANISFIFVIIIGLEYWSTYEHKQKRVSENGKSPNRRSASIPHYNCLAVGILSFVTLLISTLICILVWLK